MRDEFACFAPSMRDFFCLIGYFSISFSSFLLFDYNLLEKSIGFFLLIHKKIVTSQIDRIVIFDNSKSEKYALL